MIRGTNAEFRFDLTCNFDELKQARVTFWQDGNTGPAENRPLPIVKVLEQCKPGSHERQLSVVLNREETLRFSDVRKAYVQLWAERLDGTPIASFEQMITVYPIGDDSVLDEEILPTPDYDDWVYLDGSVIS
jgi:hypothetical protein